MEKGFDINGFMDYIDGVFIGCIGTSWTRELVMNIIQYGLEHEMVSKDQLAYWISDIIPGISFLEVARFMEDGHLTNGTLKTLGRKYIMHPYQWTS